MKITIYILSGFITVMLVWNLAAYRDVASLKQKAPAFIEERGFSITSFDGYQGSLTEGGIVWYLAKDKEGLLYGMGVSEWRGTLMLYNVKCLNAVNSKR